MLRSRGVGNNRLLVAAGALLALAACAKIVGLEDSVAGGGGGALAATGLRISPDALEFEEPCGAAAGAHYLSLENGGTEAVDYELRSPEGSRIALRDAPAGSTSLTGALAPGDIVRAHVEITPGPPGSFDGELFVRVGERVQPVPVHVVLRGGALALTPSIIDFGDVRENSISSEQTFEIENAGNEAVNVLGFTPTAAEGSADFEIAAGSVNLPPRTKQAVGARVLAGPKGEPLSAAFAPTTEQPTCATPPELTLKARRVDEPVTFNPGVLDFGEGDCNSSPGTTRKITVTNFDNTVHVTASLTAGASSWFTLTSPADFELEAGASADVIVALRPLLAATGEHSEEIVFQIGGKGSKSVTLKVTTVGAALAISPTSLAFALLSLDKDFTLTNAGNRTITVRHVSSSPDFRVTSSTTIPPGQGVSSTVWFLARDTDTHTAEITTSRDPGTTTPLCAELPIVKLSGKRL